MKYIFIFYLTLFSIIARAQDSLTCALPKDYNYVFDANLAGETYTRSFGLVGREFFFENYLVGDVFLENGGVAHNQMLKYNGRIDGLLLYSSKNKSEILLDSYFIKGFCLKDQNSNSSYMFNKIKIVSDFTEDSIQVFAHELYTGKLSLYAYRRFVFDEEVIENITGSKVAKKSFKPSYVYYFKLPNSKTIGFKRFRKRDLYKLFPENKELMRRIFKDKHQRRFKNEEDLTKITELLNPLFD